MCVTTTLLLTCLALRRSRRAVLLLLAAAALALLLLPPALPTVLEAGHLGGVVPRLSAATARDLVGVDVDPLLCLGHVAVLGGSGGSASGWRVCLRPPAHAGPGGAGVMLSFSVGGDGRFEADAAAHGFVVHWYDPAPAGLPNGNVTHRPWALAANAREELAADTRHAAAAAGTVVPHGAPAAWRRRTLTTVWYTLGQPRVALLRLAVGEDAWAALPSLLADASGGARVVVNQLVMEVRLSTRTYAHNAEHVRTLRALRAAGYRAFSLVDDDDQHGDRGDSAHDAAAASAADAEVGGEVGRPGSPLTRLGPFGPIVHCCFNMSMLYAPPAV
jgi:hypothetical protein